MDEDSDFEKSLIGFTERLNKINVMTKDCRLVPNVKEEWI